MPSCTPDAAWRACPTAATTTPTHASWALLVHGMIGTILWSPSAAIWRHEQGSPKLVKLCATSHVQHVVLANTPRCGCGGTAPTRPGGVDVFVHTWNPELASTVDAAYGRHLRGSLHEGVVYAEKTRSQALSLSRAAALMSAHERRHGHAYALAFVLRHDLFVAAPVPLADFDTSAVTFAEHCCPRDAVTRDEKAAVDARCEAGRRAYNAQRERGVTERGVPLRVLPADPDNERYRRRILGPCTPEIYKDGRQRSASEARALTLQPNNGYMVTDWWFAAPPSVVGEWRRISEEWTYFRMQARRLRLEVWSHHIWTILLHDVLNATARLAFMPGVRIGLARHVFPRLRRPCPARRLDPRGRASTRGDDRVCTLRLGNGSQRLRRWYRGNGPLGNFFTDPAGECAVLLPSMYPDDAVRLDARAMRRELPMPTVVAPCGGETGCTRDGAAFGLFDVRFAPMAAQCSWARHAKPIVCCGRPPHNCGTQECESGGGGGDAETIAANRRMALAAVAVRENATQVRRKILCRGEVGAPGNDAVELQDCYKRPEKRKEAKGKAGPVRSRAIRAGGRIHK